MTHDPDHNPRTDDSPSTGKLRKDHGLELDRINEEDASIGSTEIGLPAALSSDSPLADNLDGSTHLSGSPHANDASRFVVNLPNTEDPPTVIRGQARASDSAANDESQTSRPAAHTPSLSTRELGAALVGTQLQNYRLEEFVGGGGMGAVLRATDLTLGRTVAVKILARAGRNGELEKRFINEAQSAAKLDHEHIARVYNVGEADGLSFIVFEFVEGVNLRDSVIEHGPFSVEEVIRFTMQVAEALEHAAERSVIHRDIKPSNIILTKSGKLKLVDMGLARVQRLDADDPELTASGMTLGTFDYLSPEQARDPRQADVRSDLYSLGCTMYFLLTGEAPFPDGGAVEKLLKHRDGKRPDPRKLNPGIPNELAHVIRRLMAPNPANRFQTPGELMAVMTMVGRQFGITFSSPVVEKALARYMSRRRRIYRVLPILVPTLLLIGSLVAVDWYARRQDRQPSPQQPTYTKSSILVRRPASADSARRDDVPVDISDIELSPVPNGDSRTGIPTGGREGPEVAGLDPNDRSGSGLSDGSANSRTETETGGNRGGASGATSGRGGAAGGSSTPLRGGDGPAREMAGDSSGGNLLPFGPGGIGSDEEGISPTAGFTRVDPSIENAIVGGTWELGVLAAENTIQVRSLESLLRQLPRYPNLSNIELAFSGIQPLSRITLAKRALQITAVEGYRPRLRIESGDAGLSAQVTMEGAQLEWTGIDFLWEGANSYLLPSSLFRIQPGLTSDGEVPSLTFSDCTLTVFDNRTFLVPPDLALVEIVKPRQPLVEQPEVRQVIEPPIVKLTRSSVRGPAKLIRINEATAFQLIWDQGLFASSNRLVEAQGTKETELGFRMRLTLSKVTVAADKGLARLIASSDRPELLRLEVDATDCIFDSPRAKAFIEHVVGDESFEEQLLLIRSRSSFFPDQIPFWELQSITDRAPKRLVFLEEASQDAEWFDVDVVELASLIRWNVPEADRPGRFDQRTLADYQLKADPTSPAFFKSAGFSNVALRPFPLLGE